MFSGTALACGDLGSAAGILWVSQGWVKIAIVFSDTIVD